MSNSGRRQNTVLSPFTVQGTTNTMKIDVDQVLGLVRYFINGSIVFLSTTAGDLVVQNKIRPTSDLVTDMGASADSWKNVYTGGIVFPINTQTGAAYNVTANDNLVVINNAAATVTLLDPTLAIVGREYTVKNINAASATVVSAGVTKTIDGAASVTLTQWQRIQVVSDGTQWLVVSS